MAKRVGGRSFSQKSQFSRQSSQKSSVSGVDPQKRTILMVSMVVAFIAILGVVFYFQTTVGQAIQTGSVVDCTDLSLCYLVNDGIDGQYYSDLTIDDQGNFVFALFADLGAMQDSVVYAHFDLSFDPSVFTYVSGTCEIQDAGCSSTDTDPHYELIYDSDAPNGNLEYLFMNGDQGVTDFATELDGLIPLATFTFTPISTGTSIFVIDPDSLGFLVHDGTSAVPAEVAVPADFLVTVVSGDVGPSEMTLEFIEAGPGYIELWFSEPLAVDDDQDLGTTPIGLTQGDQTALLAPLFTLTKTSDSSIVSGYSIVYQQHDYVAFDLSQFLEIGQEYTLSLDQPEYLVGAVTGATSPSGVEITFAYNPPLLVESTSPVDGATDVALDSSVTITFNQDYELMDDPQNIFEISSGGSPLAFTTTQDATSITLIPDGILTEETAHIVSFACAAVEILGGIDQLACGVDTDYTFSFTTVGPGGDQTAPEIVSTTPADTDADVASSVEILLTFTEDLFTDDGQTLPDEGYLESVISVAENGAFIPLSELTTTLNSNEISIARGSPYADAATIEVVVQADALYDAAGNPFAGVQFSFTIAEGDLGTQDVCDLDNADLCLDQQDCESFGHIWSDLGDGLRCHSDTDGDGYADDVDFCPTQPYDTNDGCPPQDSSNRPNYIVLEVKNDQGQIMNPSEHSQPDELQLGETYTVEVTVTHDSNGIGDPADGYTLPLTYDSSYSGDYEDSYPEHKLISQVYSGLLLPTTRVVQEKPELADGESETLSYTFVVEDDWAGNYLRVDVLTWSNWLPEGEAISQPYEAGYLVAAE